MLLSEIAQDFSTEATIGPNVSQKLADILNQRWSSKLDESKLKDKMGKYDRPGNCEKLAVPKVNPEIWSKLQHATRGSDLRLANLQKTLVLPHPCYVTTGLHEIAPAITTPMQKHLQSFTTSPLAILPVLVKLYLIILNKFLLLTYILIHIKIVWFVTFWFCFKILVSRHHCFKVSCNPVVT